jgi:hypothetical protein
MPAAVHKCPMLWVPWEVDLKTINNLSIATSYVILVLGSSFAKVRLVGEEKRFISLIPFVRQVKIQSYKKEGKTAIKT